jgi:hypothetical protein
LLPPTMATLDALQSFATVADVFAAAADRVVAAVRPKLRVAADGSVSVELPDGSLVAIPASMVAQQSARRTGET